jgi:hypothetical protein
MVLHLLLKRALFRCVNRRSQILGSAILVLLGLLYCADALWAPFFGGSDMLSNMLPIVHYRVSILQDHTFPWYTNLWYGGRYQWMNPLWNFLYIPATIIWLVWPLEWATRIVVCGHLIFSALAGRYLASLFFKREFNWVIGGVLLTAPITAALRAGHLEKIMAWPWVLLGLRFLLDTRHDDLKRGLFSGACLGIIALTGANYYVLYAVILYTVILASLFDKRLVSGLVIGSLVGLLHVPSVWYLVGQVREDPVWSIPTFSLSLFEAFNDLFIGVSANCRWESSSMIGAPVAGVFFICFYKYVRTVFRTSHRGSVYRPQKTALLVAILILTLLVTGTLYQGHHLLDTFRVPSRAIPFVAIAVLLFIFFSVRDLMAEQSRQSLIESRFFLVLIAASVVHVSFICWWVRPQGSDYWLDNSGAMDVALFLKSQNAHSVWTSTRAGTDMLIDLALNVNGIELPNVYYGDMKQTIPVKGEHCRYSFDFILIDHSLGQSPAYDLISDKSPHISLGKILASQMLLVGTFKVAERVWDVYQVACTP